MIFTNCSKESMEQQVQSDSLSTVSKNDNSYLFQPTVSPDSEAIKQRIQNFRGRLNNTETGGTDLRESNLTAKEAEWNIEANLNATYARADVSFSKLEKNKIEFDVPVSGGTIADADLLAAYKTAKDALANHYKQVNDKDKQVLAIDIELVKETANKAQYQQISYIAIVPPALLRAASCEVYGETDFWYWGQDQGRCCEGGGEGIDAADVLGQELNLRYPLPDTHLYFTNIERRDIDPDSFPNPDDDVLNDSHRDYLIFDCYLDDDCDCINPDDMNWYYCNIREIITDLKPSGKNFSHIDLYDESTLSGEGGRVLHIGLIFYGKSIQCPCNPCSPLVHPSTCGCC